MQNAKLSWIHGGVRAGLWTGLVAFLSFAAGHLTWK